MFLGLAACIAKVQTSRGSRFQLYGRDVQAACLAEIFSFEYNKLSLRWWAVYPVGSGMQFFDLGYRLYFPRRIEKIHGYDGFLSKEPKSRTRL